MLEKIENRYFQLYSSIDIYDVPLVFIVGSPRTGSTLLYQLMINFFNFYYFTNFVNNNFYMYPIVGTVIQEPLRKYKRAVEYESYYGKTKGLFGPSEASFIFRRWYGGEHPSQLYSSKVLPYAKEHMVNTFKSIYGLTYKAVLTKNAWNCFRIENLSNIFPNIHYVWIRRDIRDAAFSDLEARYKRGSPYHWNSATTANYKEIQKLPYWEQVVEQQYWFNVHIEKELNIRSSYQIWYEDICSDKLEDKLHDLYVWLKDLLSIDLDCKVFKIKAPKFTPSTRLKRDDDYSRIEKYVKNNLDRMERFTYE